jgi:hypothetical protein
MKKILFLLVASIVVAYFGISTVRAQETEKKEETPAAAEKPQAPAVKPETLSGTLTMVAADKKLVVVTGSGGVPYNFNVTGATKIKLSGAKAKLADLSGATGRSATVKFLPEKHAGNIAQSIEVQ